MIKNKPVDARVRLAIAQWSEDAPRGSVTTFCVEHGITRKTFYAIRARAREEGQAAALEPRSRRPKSSPTQLSETLKQDALQVRAALESSGLDHGPISVHDKMVSLKMQAPSIASLARIFREKNVARLEPKKRPRAAYRQFVYPAPNACWQLDATEYVLTRGRTCVIFQLQDDHSRRALATHVAFGETSEAAIAVVKKGIAAHGVPQRLLTDNGSALNPSRRGRQGQLVAYVLSLGVEPITGKPNKPTTQGKNERFHQTLFRWLDKQPLAGSLAELQAQVDRFDIIYNTERPHQGLPGRITPQESWNATAVAQAPRPKPVPPLPLPSAFAAKPLATSGSMVKGDDPHLATTDSQPLKVYSHGGVSFRGVMYSLSNRMSGQTVIAVWDISGIAFVSTAGEVITQYDWPPQGTKYVGKSRARLPDQK